MSNQDGYTPTTEQVRRAYAHEQSGWAYEFDGPDELAEFDRWLAAHDDALIEIAIAWVGRAWDDGNGSGLDGWVGPGRGAGEVDREAQHARTRLIRKADAALEESAREARDDK